MSRIYAFAVLAVLSTVLLAAVEQSAMGTIMPEVPTVQSGDLARGSCPEPPC